MLKNELDAHVNKILSNQINKTDALVKIARTHTHVPPNDGIKYLE